MSRLSHRRAVFLVGFMGAGKTAVGRALANQLKWRFVDLDDEIERAAKRSVAEIFKARGETDFRKLESRELRRTLERVQNEGATVIALGGGTFAQAENAEQLRQSRVPVVFLDAPLEELLRRCQAEPERVRPLLDRGGEALSILYAERRPLYLAADATVQTLGKSIPEVAGEVARWLMQD
jgi:shikimate kinase